MDLTIFIQETKEILKDYIKESGSFLYSGNKSLKKGDIYLIGFNPGGSDSRTIEEDLNSFPTKTENSYLDEEWDNKRGSISAGKSPLQSRIKWLVEKLGYDLRTVCSSNLIFKRSKDAVGVSYNSDADRCWPVHEKVLKIVKPRLILTIGNSSKSSFDYILTKMKVSNSEIELFESGHRNWKIKKFETVINGHKICVVGLPHLSRYDPRGKKIEMKIIEWMENI